MSYYLPYFIRINSDSIIEAILNQYDPIAKTINSTHLTSREVWKITPMQHDVEKTELIAE